MKEKTYKTILVIVIGLLCLSFIFNSSLLVKISTVLGFLALIHVRMANMIEYLWQQIAKVLGWINSRVLLTLIYYLILLPTSLLSRLFIKENQIQRKKNSNSYYLDRDHNYTAEDMKNVW